MTFNCGFCWCELIVLGTTRDLFAMVPPKIVTVGAKHIVGIFIRLSEWSSFNGFSKNGQVGSKGFNLTPKGPISHF